MNISKEDQELLKTFIVSTNALRKTVYKTNVQLELLSRNEELSNKVYKAFLLPKVEKSKFRQITLDEAIANEKRGG